MRRNAAVGFQASLNGRPFLYCVKASRSAKVVLRGAQLRECLDRISAAPAVAQVLLVCAQERVGPEFAAELHGYRRFAARAALVDFAGGGLQLDIVRIGVEREAGV